MGAPAALLLTTFFRKGDVELTFFSTLTTFGTPYDVALQGGAACSSESLCHYHKK